MYPRAITASSEPCLSRWLTASAESREGSARSCAVAVEQERGVRHGVLEGREIFCFARGGHDDSYLTLEPHRRRGARLRRRNLAIRSPGLCRSQRLH